MSAYAVLTLQQAIDDLSSAITYATTGGIPVIQSTKDHVRDTIAFLSNSPQTLTYVDGEPQFNDVSSVYKMTIEAPSDSNVMRQVIGKDGCYFKITSDNCNLLFLWHYRTGPCRDTISFWGLSLENVSRAVNIIRSRIDMKTA